MNISLLCTFATDELEAVLCAPLGDAVRVTVRTTRQLDDGRGDRFDVTATASVPVGQQIAMAADAVEQWDEPNGSITLRFDHDALAELCSTLASRELRGRVPVMIHSGDLEVGLPLKLTLAQPERQCRRDSQQADHKSDDRAAKAHRYTEDGVDGEEADHPGNGQQGDEEPRTDTAHRTAAAVFSDEWHKPRAQQGRDVEQEGEAQRRFRIVASEQKRCHRHSATADAR